MRHTTTVETADGQLITTEDTYSSQLPDGTLEIRSDTGDGIVAAYGPGDWASIAVTRAADAPADTEAD